MTHPCLSVAKIEGLGEEGISSLLLKHCSRGQGSRNLRKNEVGIGKRRAGRRRNEKENIE